MPRRPAISGLILATVISAALLLGLPAPGGDAQAAKRVGTGGGLAKVGKARAVSRSAGACSFRAQRRQLSARARKSAVRRARRCRDREKAVASEASGPIYWGAWIGNQLTGDEAPWDMGAVERFEGLAGKRVSMINFSSPFADCSGASCDYYEFPEGPMDNIRGHGSIPFFSWASQSTPARLDQPEFQLGDVVSGSHDAYIREWAEAARDWGHPFFLRFNWEMNGNWFAWSEGVNGNLAGEYVAAWRHVHDIFTAAGATNATWVWCPNVDPAGKLQDLAPLYPGDAYVDWTGLDGYNWGTNPARPDRWRSFDELFRSTYDEITTTIAPGKPMIVSEIGSTEHGGSKAEWIADALATARTEYPKLRGLLWFEKFDDGMDWPIETSTASSSAFAAAIADPTYLGNSFGAAAPGKIQPLG